MTIGRETYSSAIEDATNYTKWILDAFKPFYGRRLLEVGLGHGAYRLFMPELDLYVGMDIDPSAVEQARARHPDDSFIVGDVTDPGIVSQLHDAHLDTVLCVNVLEHIPEDRQAVMNMLRMLAPGGHLLILVPAFPGLYSGLDRLAGHRRRYKKSDIRRLLGADTGSCVMMRYFNSVGGVGWWMNKLFQHRSLDSKAVNAQIQMFDRWVLPLSRLVDPLTRSFFGQSLICTVEKS